MRVFRKNTQIIDEHQQTGKTPVTFGKRQKNLKAPKRKHLWRRRVVTAFVLLIVGALGYFGFRAYGAIKDVFSGENTILSLLGGSQGKLLKGEIDGRVNILLLGIGDEGHAGENLSDTMIVASYDTKSKAISMVSLPRDFYAKIPGGNYYAKLNAAHAYGESRQAGNGPMVAKQAIEEISGLPIHYYARVDFTGLVELVDAVGGVEVDVQKAFCDYGYTKAAYYHPVCFKEGLQTMSGAKALKYARSRKASGSEGTDFARSQRQQRIVIALKNKVLSTETLLNPTKILKIMTSLGKHLKTDLGLSEISRAYEIGKAIDSKTIITKNVDPASGLVKTNPGTAAGYILIPTAGQGVYTDIQAYFKNVFAGVEIRKEAAKVSFINGTWSTYYYTNLTNKFESDGLDIVFDGGTRSRNTSVTTIVDYSGGEKTKTVRYLEEELGVKSTAGTRKEGQTYDIEITLGRDYR